jgi:large subunit ribosomal protein L10
MEFQGKETIINGIRERIKGSVCFVLADYQGMNVASLQKLRTQMKKRGLEFTVLKNTLVKKAAGEFGLAEALTPFLKGMTAITWSREDPSAPTKMIKEYQREDAKLKIKCGVLEGRVLSGRDVESLASLPDKQQVKAMLLGCLEAPARTFLSLLQAPARNFAGVMDACKRAKEGA